MNKKYLMLLFLVPLLNWQMFTLRFSLNYFKTFFSAFYFPETIVFLLIIAMLTVKNHKVKLFTAFSVSTLLLAVSVLSGNKDWFRASLAFLPVVFLFLISETFPDAETPTSLFDGTSLPLILFYLSSAGLAVYSLAKMIGYLFSNIHLSFDYLWNKNFFIVLFIIAGCIISYRRLPDKSSVTKQEYVEVHKQKLFLRAVIVYSVTLIMYFLVRIFYYNCFSAEFIFPLALFIVLRLESIRPSYIFGKGCIFGKGEVAV